MGASTSVQQSNPLLPAGLEKDDFVALSSNYDINAISQPSGAKFSISGVGEVGIALAQSPLAEKFNRVSYDKRKFFLGEDNIPYSRQVLYAWQCPKGHSLVPIVACPSVSFLPSQCTGLSAPQVEKEPLVMMPQTSDVPQTSHTDSDPLQLTSNKKTGNYAMQNSRIQSDSLRNACADGNLDLVSKLLDQGVDVNNQNVMGITPLHACAFASNIKIAQLLISHGADQMQGDLSEMAPIHYAAAEGALELVRYFVECAGTSIAGIVGAEGITPAHMAANIGHDEVLQYISEECGPEYCNQLDDQGNSPLHIASSRGHAKCVDVLLQIGCSANLRNSNDLTPLMAALRANDADRTLDAARLLLPFTQVLETDGVVIPPKLFGNGILHSLSPFSDEFPKDVLEIERTTKLHAAVMCGSIFELRELLFAGAKVDYFDAEGFTPFHLACSKNRLDMAALMLNFGIIAELATSLLLPGTDSPLICSIVANSFPLVQYLVRKFPSWLEVRDSKGVLPVAVALDNRCSLALVRALVVVGGANLKAIAKSHNSVFRNHENVASEVQPKSVYAYASNFRTEAAQFVEIMGVQPIAAKFCWCNELAKYVDVWSEDQCPLVHQAAFFGRLPALLELLKCGRPLSDDQDAAGFTALHAACASGSLEIVNLLLNANCIVDTSDNQGHFSPLFFSVNGGFPILVERLLPLVLDASTLYDSQDRSLLSFLPSDESAAIAISSIILSLFPFIDGFVENPRVAAHIEHVRSTAQSSASSICNSDTLSLTNLLAELPLLIHCRMNDEGHTLLHLACERLEASVCVELLCSVGAPVEAVMSNGLSALHVAALYKNLAAMTVLLSYGASADLPDQNGFTPLHIVAIESYSDGIDLLLTEWHAESMSTPFRIDSRYESLSRPSSADASTFNGCTNNTDRIADEVYCHICLLSASHSDTFDWFTCSVQNCCNGYSICVTCIGALIEKERSTSPYAEIRSSSPNLAMQSIESSKLGISFDKKGVRLNYLRAFKAKYSAACGFMNSEQVCHLLIKPQTALQRCSVVSQLVREDKSFDWGQHSNWIVCHAWGNSFFPMIDAILSFFELRADADAAVLWIDLFSTSQHVNQHSTASPMWWRDFSTFVEGAGKKMLLVFDSWKEPKPLQRSWCLMEALTFLRQVAKRRAGFFKIIIYEEEFHDMLRVARDNPEEFCIVLSNLIDRVDVESSQCTFEEEKKCIFEVLEHFGTLKMLNCNISEIVENWVFDLLRQMTLKMIEAGVETDIFEFRISLAKIFTARGRFNEALQQRELLLERQYKLLDERSISCSDEVVSQTVSLARALNDVAEGYARLKRFKDSLKFQQEAQKYYKRVLSDNDLQHANLMAVMAQTHLDLDEGDIALQLTISALEFHLRVLPSNDPRIFAAESSVAAMHRGLHDFNNAFDLESKVLQKRQLILPENHPDIASSHFNIALTLPFVESLPLSERNSGIMEHLQIALKVWRNSLGPSDPRVLLAKQKLALFRESLEHETLDM